MSVTIELVVNGQTRTVTTDAQRPLLDVLREDLGLTGTKYGCGEGECGACAVLVDGRHTLSCRMPVEAARLLQAAADRGVQLVIMTATVNHAIAGTLNHPDWLD